MLNLSDPLSHYGKDLGLPIFCIGIIFFILRGVSRFLTRTFFRLEDSLFYAASFFSVLVWAGNWVSWGNDGSVDTVNNKTGEFSLTPAGQVQTVATEVLSVVTIVIWKSYLIVMYCRFFEPGPALRVIYAVTGLIVLHALIGIIGSLAQCVPISMLGQFMDDNKNHQCMSGAAYGVVLYLPDLISALAVLILPLFYLRRKEWTLVRKIALGWMITAGFAIILFTIFGMANAILRYESDPWWASTALAPLYVSFFYMLIGCYGELHPLWSKEHRQMMREGDTATMYRLGSGQYSLYNYTQAQPYISSPLPPASPIPPTPTPLYISSRRSSVGEEVPKYLA